MSLELSQLYQLASGQKAVVTIGNLPRPIAEYLGCHPAIVFMRQLEFLKITKKHKEIHAVQLLQLPFLVERGAYYADHKRPNCVTVDYCLPDDEEMYRAGLKAADRGREVWVQTFHRTNETQARRLARSAALLLPGK